MKQRFIAASAVLLVLAVATFYAVHRRTQTETTMNGKNIQTLVDPQTLQSLAHKSASTADVSRIGPGVLPPTNTWLSGMVLQQNPEPVYPMPNSFLARSGGFELGLPRVHSTATEIDGEHAAGLTVGLGSDNFQLTRYDKLSATLTYQKGSASLGNLTVTEGSPFVFYSSHAATTLTVDGINPSDVLEHTDHYIRYNRSGYTYAIYSANATFNLARGTLAIRADKGALLAFYSLPDAQSDPLKQYAGNAIESVSVAHSQTASHVTTTFSYRTANAKPTVFVALPYQQVGGTSIASYDSIYGQMRTIAGNTFTSSVTAVQPNNQLQLKNLSAAQKSTLIASLPTDVASTTIDQQDSYFAGKQLARAANLLDIATQLGQTAQADKLRTILNKAFAARLDGSYFYYDTKLKGAAANTHAFGSEDFNDHHFHYGYWLYAASILGKYDNKFVSTYQKPLNLLAADIASYTKGSDFPVERNYDPYVGHSWAAGLAPFADGNNQESSSEAVHAWNGVSLWGQVTKNQSLSQVGQWMLANEANAAAATWRTVDTSDPALKNYASPVVSLNFAGKRTYSTFFSDAPSAKLGIQLIPMDPSMTNFASDKSIQKIVAGSIQNDEYNVPLGDYVLEYLALSNPQKAASLASRQTAIDDGNSRTYLNAFIFSQLTK